MKLILIASLLPSLNAFGDIFVSKSLKQGWHGHCPKKEICYRMPNICPRDKWVIDGKSGVISCTAYVFKAKKK